MNILMDGSNKQSFKSITETELIYINELNFCYWSFNHRHYLGDKERKKIITSENLVA